MASAHRRVIIDDDDSDSELSFEGNGTYIEILFRWRSSLSTYVTEIIAEIDASHWNINAVPTHMYWYDEGPRAMRPPMLDTNGPISARTRSRRSGAYPVLFDELN